MSENLFNRLKRIVITVLLSVVIIFIWFILSSDAPAFSHTTTAFYWAIPCIILIFFIILIFVFDVFEKMKRNPLVKYLIILLILLFFGSIILAYYQAEKIKIAYPIEMRDRVRKSDISQIVTMMDIYKKGNNQYLQSKTIPTSIGEIISTPTDPSDSSPYYWLDNTFGATTGCDSQYFCVLAKLEKDGFFAGSEKGTTELSTQPTKCPCW